MNLSMAIPSVITSYTKLKEILGVLGPLEKANTVATIAQTKASLEQASANIAKTESNVAAATARKEEAQAALQEAIVKKDRAILDGKIAKNKVQEIAATYELAVAEIDLASARKAVEAAQKEELSAIRENIAAKKQKALLDTDLKETEDKLAGSQENLNKIIGFLKSPLGIAIAAITAAIVIINAYGNSLEESRKKSRELADESVQVAEETKKNVEN